MSHQVAQKNDRHLMYFLKGPLIRPLMAILSSDFQPLIQYISEHVFSENLTTVVNSLITHQLSRYKTTPFWSRWFVIQFTTLTTYESSTRCATVRLRGLSVSSGMYPVTQPCPMHCSEPKCRKDFAPSPKPHLSWKK